MPALLKKLAAALAVRRMARDLGAIKDALIRQNALLLRLADHFAPSDPDTSSQDVQTETGVDHLDPAEAALAYDFVNRTRLDTGRFPDDEEVLAYLADEKTHDLHLRMREREQQAARIERERVSRGPR
jgi:hypothetical protein